MPRPAGSPAAASRAAAAVLAVALSIALGGAPAGARSVKSGTQTRLKRMAVLDVSQLLWNPYPIDEEEGLVRLLGYSNEPHPGERFVLVDGKGPYAAVVVREIEELNSYGGPPSYSVIARYTESPIRAADGEAVALGPTQRSLTHARVMPYQAMDHAPMASQFPLVAVDGDGDGQPDFVVGSTTCGDEVSMRWPDWGMDCFNSWAKEGTGWKLIEKSMRAYEGD